MIPERLENGNLLVPAGGYDEELEVSTDSMVEVAPDHPSYVEWLEVVERQEQQWRRFVTMPGDVVWLGKGDASERPGDVLDGSESARRDRKTSAYYARAEAEYLRSVGHYAEAREVMRAEAKLQRQFERDQGNA